MAICDGAGSADGHRQSPLRQRQQPRKAGNRKRSKVADKEERRQTKEAKFKALMDSPSAGLPLNIRASWVHIAYLPYQRPEGKFGR